MRKLIVLLAVVLLATPMATAQTKTSSSVVQVVTANAKIAATMTFTSSLNPSKAGQTITYSGTVTGSNNGASPTGTVTVVGITGTQTVSLGTNGAFTCSETPTAPTASNGFTVTATYNGDVNFY